MGCVGALLGVVLKPRIGLSKVRGVVVGRVCIGMACFWFFGKPARGRTVGANKKPLRFGTGGAKVVRRIRPPAARG
jgi:hypothetical protein